MFYIKLNIKLLKERRKKLELKVKENIRKYNKKQEIINLEYIILPNDLSSDNNHNCSICLEKINHISYIKTYCNHHFHRECINSWKRIGKNSCPNCRKNI